MGLKALSSGTELYKKAIQHSRSMPIRQADKKGITSMLGNFGKDYMNGLNSMDPFERDMYFGTLGVMSMGAFAGGSLLGNDD